MMAKFRSTIILEIHPSARKHGISDADIEHAVSHAMSIYDQDDDLRLYLGAARNTDLIEVATVVHSDLVETAVHAMKMPYGTTAGGEPITDELIERLAAKAEAGFDVDEILRRRRGRPPMGSGPATVESVRLDPELRDALSRRAKLDGEATSTVIRKALRQYLV
jgi:hypothetical protein